VPPRDRGGFVPAMFPPSPIRKRGAAVIQFQSLQARRRVHCRFTTGSMSRSLSQLPLSLMQRHCAQTDSPRMQQSAKQVPHAPPPVEACVATPRETRTDGRKCVSQGTLALAPISQECRAGEISFHRRMANVNSLIIKNSKTLRRKCSNACETSGNCGTNVD